ncbi:hypothetical protein BHE90_003042 [Fusarium euwallaceae]|uniref:Uncharacterized protein n=1 Tax=Fusarium euwallaceae TaxID=1147111 RepID=A0A430M302_9HYPO|nr:hypothetical protein BHE90_003042 [Fusarium euwallaceae]
MCPDAQRGRQWQRVSFNSTDAYRKSAYIYIGVLFNNRELVALEEQREHLDKPVSDDEYFQCQPYRVIYRLNVTFINDVRRLQVVGEEFVDRVPWPMFPGNTSLSATYKESNIWAYRALADLVGQHVQGHIWFPRGGWGGQVTTTILSYSSLVGPQRDFRNLNETLFTSVEWPKLGFRQGIVDLVRNVSISLLADPTLHIYDTSPGICETFSASNIWRYDPKALWIAYGAICLVCTVGVVIGAIAMRLNGCSSDVSFSRIMCTTRNISLDQAAAGSRFGAHPLGEELEKLPLKFGELSDQGHVGSRGREGYGRELWLNVNDYEIIEDVIRADTRESVEIDYYFESLKEAYRKLEHIPCRGRVTTEAEDIPERESDVTMEEVHAQTER